MNPRRYHLSLLLILCGLFTTNGIAQKYDIIPLGSLGGSYPTPYGINEQSQVVGYSYTPGDLLWHAFRWQNGGMTDLGGPGATYSMAYRINEQGLAVGFREFTDSVLKRHAYLWEGGVRTDLGTLGGTYSNAASINDSGFVVGSSHLPGNTEVHSFSWKNGVMTDLGTMGGETFSGALGINNHGHIIGNYDPPDSVVHGFLWRNGGATDLGGLVYPEEINDQVQVVGYARHTPFGNMYAFIWENGSMTDLGTLGGQYAKAFGINDKGKVVGVCNDSNFTSRAFIWENGAMKDLNGRIDSNSGWILRSANAINNRGEIVGTGDLYGVPNFAFLLRPRALAITEPRAGDRWIAGERDTIRWSNGPEGDFVNIFFSDDSGETYSEIGENVPADSGYYVWTPSELVLSTDCFISIGLVSDPAVEDTSGRFRVKGYQLTRFDARGKYDPFQFNRDNWNFSNTRENMWPRSWWQQFDYAHGLDPHTNARYPLPWPYWPIRADSSDFPDWPLFVNIFGVDQCYFDTSLAVYKPSAVAKWQSIKKKWGGSCLGFAVSSLMLFDDPAVFLAQYPEMGLFTNTFSSDHNNERRKLLSTLWGMQFGVPHAEYVNQVSRTTPKQTILQIKEMFLSDDRDDRVLALYNQNGSGGHAVTPYLLRENLIDPNSVYVYVYDNNHAGDNTLRFIVDTSTNFWTYSSQPTWGGYAGLFLMDPVSTYLSQPSLPKTDPAGLPSAQSIGSGEIYFTNASSMTILNAAGDTAGYVDGKIIGGDTASFPIIPITGSDHPPIGFLIPQGSHSISIGGFEDSTISVSMFGDSVDYLYHRSDAESTQHDMIEWTDGILVSNADGQSKAVSLEGIAELPDEERVFGVGDAVLGGGDSLRIVIAGKRDLHLINHGSLTSCTLTFGQASAAGEEKYLNAGITLEAGASYQFVPDWNDISASDVMILIDRGNDGSYEDTVYAENQLTEVDDRVSGRIPSAYALFQNYPNPFNPSTTIEYGVPSTGHVSLKVFDVLGREVATLFDGIRTPGVYSARWDASGEPGGIYFCRLQAEVSVQTIKLGFVR